MSIFHLWTYRFLKLYNSGIIWYEKNLRNPLAANYKKMYHGRIADISCYNVYDVRRTTLYTIGVWRTLFDMCWHIWSGATITHGAVTEFHSSGALLAEHPPIYRMRCWDNRCYLTRSGFDLATRTVCAKRRICLHASISDKIDVTWFVNQHPESFTDENYLTIPDVLTMLLLDHKISLDDFFVLLQDRGKFFYVIDDETLEVRTFKDNDNIVL